MLFSGCCAESGCDTADVYLSTMTPRATPSFRRSWSSKELNRGAPGPDKTYCLRLRFFSEARIGMAAYGRSGLSAVGRSTAAFSAPANSGAEGLLPCICTCGFDCDGDCIVVGSCGHDALVECAANCCEAAPFPDPGCGHVGPIDS
jgi:hypothetical protein